MSGLEDLLGALGIPAGIATVIILGALLGDRLLKYQAEREVRKVEQTHRERELLSADQDSFRKAVLSQTEQLRAQLAEQTEALDAAHARYVEDEKRIGDLQMTVARLAALLITNNVPLPVNALLSPDTSPRTA